MPNGAGKKIGKAPGGYIQRRSQTGLSGNERCIAAYGKVYLPFTLDKKYKHAARKLGRQYVFPYLDSHGLPLKCRSDAFPETLRAENELGGLKRSHDGSDNAGSHDALPGQKQPFH